MSEFPETRPSLLIEIKDPNNRDAWDRFAQLYQPVIIRTAMVRGLQYADALDLSQQVLISVARAINGWKPKTPSVRFRHWLSRVTRNAIINALSRKPIDQAAGGTEAGDYLQYVADETGEITDRIELEYRRELFLQAADIVQADVHPDTWLAFTQTVIEALPINQIAQQLGKTDGAIYTARSRVMLRLRETISHLEEQD